MSGKWTPQQLNAINSENCAALVSAAAGSGKTSVLVERVIRLLSSAENKIPADRMVIVTFTNDAAAQMKQRLSAALSEEVNKNPGNAWLCRQQAMINTAKISTIHSFCFDLIRENVQSLDVSTGFRILDETENSAVIKDAVNNVFEKLYTDNAVLMNKLADFFCREKRDDMRLESNILALYDFLMSIPFYEDWLIEFRNKNTAEFSGENNPLAELYLKELLRVYKKCGKYSKEAVLLCGEIYTETGGKRNEKAMAVLRDEYDFFSSRVKELENPLNSWDMRVGTKTFKFGRLVFSGKPDEKETEISSLIKTLRNNYKELYGNTVKSVFSLDYIKEDNAATAEILDGFIVIIKLLDIEISRLKSEKNALGFSDAEQLAIRLLCRKNDDGTIERTPLSEELSEYYKIIMIDEFQDANNTQDMIFKLLSHNGSPYKAGDNLFVVGDAKQSIYHFRLANPKLLINALHNAGMYPGEKGKESVKILLNKNFRSSPDVLDFTNYVFESLMSENTGGINYGEDERLVQGAVFPDVDSSGNRIDRTTEILFVNPAAAGQTDDETVQDNTDGNEETAENNDIITESETQEKEAEAEAVAKKISDMAGKTEICENGMLRKSKYGDFCILLRSNAAQQLYSKALMRYGIKSVKNKPPGYLKSREIAVLLSLLSVIDNPLQDIHLCAVLMSPMFLLDANDTAKIRLLTKAPKSPLFPRIRDIVRSKEILSEADGILYKKLSSFMDIYDMLRVKAASLSLDRLIGSIYDSTGFLSVVQVYKDGEQKKANLRLLLEYAKSYEQNSSGGLSGFLRYINAMSERGLDFSIAAATPASDDSVLIKTIHGSKGLEFPYVFLCGTSKEFNLKNTDKDGFALSSYFNLEYGIGFRIQDYKNKKLYDSFQQSMIKRINESEAVSEEMRLLYVALTRAKEKLFISIVNSGKTKKRIKAVSDEILSEGGVTENVALCAKSMLDWLLAVLIIHPEFNKAAGLADIPCNDNPVPLKVTVTEIGAQTAQNNTSIRAEADGGQVEMLKKRFDFKYDNTLTQKTAKLTITEIVKNETEDGINFRRPAFVTDTKDLSAAEIGTAMHTFMQYADFTRAAAGIKAEGLRLCDYGILTQAEYSSLRFGKLEKFFESDLYMRILKSKEVYREQKFLVGISELDLDDELGKEYNNTSGMLQGIADCFFKEDDGFVLIDYKTDRVYNSQFLVSRYERQLKLYSKAIGKIYGAPVKEAYIYSFSLDKALQIVVRK